MSRWNLILCMGILGAACGSSSGGTDSGTPGNDAGPPGPTLHGCSNADFVDRTAGSDDSRMIMVPNGTLSFDFPCMTIRAGQAVMFMWDFVDHPLEPGVAPGEEGQGTEPSPILPQETGSLYTATFDTPGTYPFYCTVHHDASMVGVIRVVP
jgi:plastocyanin